MPPPCAPLPLQAEKEELVRKVKARDREARGTLMGQFPNKKELEDWIHATGRQNHPPSDKIGREHG